MSRQLYNINSIDPVTSSGEKPDTKTVPDNPAIPSPA
jgi:hypothetical protein